MMAIVLPAPVWAGADGDWAVTGPVSAATVSASTDTVKAPLRPILLFLIVRVLLSLVTGSSPRARAAELGRRPVRAGLLLSGWTIGQRFARRRAIAGGST